MEPPDASRRIIPCGLASEESGRSGENSSQAAVGFHVDQAWHVEFALPDDLRVAQIAGEQIPHRFTVLANAYGHGGPARDLIGFPRFDGPSRKTHVGDSPARFRIRVAAVAHS